MRLQHDEISSFSKEAELPKKHTAVPPLVFSWEVVLGKKEKEN